MNRKNLLAIILMGTFIFSCKQAAEKNQTVDLNSQQELIFPKGEKVTNNNFIGDVWVHMQVMADSVNQNSVGTVTFDPGARSNWHSHPNGQIIMSLDGEGYYQIAITSRVDGPTEWLDPVSEEQYLNGN